MMMVNDDDGGDDDDDHDDHSHDNDGDPVEFTTVLRAFASLERLIRKMIQ